MGEGTIGSTIAYERGYHIINWGKWADIVNKAFKNTYTHDIDADVIKTSKHLLSKLVQSNTDKFPQLRNISKADELFNWGKIFQKGPIQLGNMHRWKHGHDLLVDVPKVLLNKGPEGVVHRIGHILLTDLPTKAGDPDTRFIK